MRFATGLGVPMAVLACACLPALAMEEDGPAPNQYGFTLLASLPRQDLREIDNRNGFGAGVFVENQVGAGTTLQARVDYLSYPQTNRPRAAAIAAHTVPDPRTLAVNSLSLGLDLRHPLPVPALSRCFALAGIMAVRYEFDTSGLNALTDQNGVPVGGIRRFKDKTSLKLGLALGLGLELYRGVTLTERYTTIDIDGATLAAYETGLSFRF